MNAPDIEGAFALHAARTRFADIPPLAVAKAKTFLLDTLGVGLAGRAGADLEAVSRLAARWGPGDEATSWRDGARLSAGSAAIVNAYLIHCLEFDCVHEGAVVHPMATLVSALFAWAEREATEGRPVDGARFLAALAVGVDVAALIGVATDSPVRFFRPATAGGFGAVAAIANLAGFDAETTRSALGHMYGQTSGTLQPHLEGSPLLGLQIGFNARGAICAADLAAAGMPGPREALSGRYGYFALMEGGSCRPERIAERLGREWQVARLAHKPYPSGRLTHGVVHGLRALMAAHGFTAEDVAEVVATVPPLVLRLVGRPLRPRPAANYAKLCLPFVAGVYLAKGRCDVPDFLGAALADPEVHRHAAKVRVVQDDNPDENALSPQRIAVRLSCGARHEVLLPVVYGHPDAPLSEAENEEKFLRCCAHAGIGRQQAEAIRDLVARAERVPDVSAIVRALVPRG
ncbi:MAG: MmgE/PrpD family protein [Acetobacteraceae bacterium]|nr:MmgE/PrpD family protein [Acetobacteraceae bacterium]MCX7684721.1 MmgE/PrpD family protein [Acetobacteraceae bacterium]MDW8397656.1 MmgE/PrpD family protein [Acetobacteraceae bacterium]